MCHMQHNNRSVAHVNKRLYEKMNVSNNVTKYATLRVKPETQDRVNRYIGECMSKDGERVTVDDMVSKALDALRELKHKR